MYIFIIIFNQSFDRSNLILVFNVGPFEIRLILYWQRITDFNPISLKDYEGFRR